MLKISHDYDFCLLLKNAGKLHLCKPGSTFCIAASPIRTLQTSGGTQIDSVGAQFVSHAGKPQGCKPGNLLLRNAVISQGNMLFAVVAYRYTRHKFLLNFLVGDWGCVDSPQTVGLYLIPGWGLFRI